MVFYPLQDPDATYRVSAKALVFDSEGRLLVFKDDHGNYEMPGGGWEHGESFDECLKREFMEEAGVALTKVGDVEFCWRGYVDDERGHRLKLAARAELATTKFKLTGDDSEVLVEARFVAKDEFLSLPFQAEESGVKDFVDKIWPDR